MANNELSGSIVSLSLIDYFKKKINKSLQGLSLFQKQLVQLYLLIKISTT